MATLELVLWEMYPFALSLLVSKPPEHHITGVF